MRLLPTYDFVKLLLTSNAHTTTLREEMVTDIMPNITI